MIKALLPGAYFPSSGEEIDLYGGAFKWDLTRFAGNIFNSRY
jgi:hypothetical protein